MSKNTATAKSATAEPNMPSVQEMAAIVAAETDDIGLKAKDLDQAINANLERLGQQLAATYLELGRLLQQMFDTKGWQCLETEYKTWSDYLQSKRVYGKTYLSYLLKLGKADQAKLSALLANGLTGTHLVEFAKATDYPHKIPDLIEATWNDVGALSTRQAADVIRNYVKGHQKTFKKVRKVTKAARKRPDGFLDRRIEAVLKGLTADERSQVLERLRAKVEVGARPGKNGTKKALATLARDAAEAAKVTNPEGQADDSAATR